MYKMTGNIVEIFKTIQQTERYKNRVIVIKDESSSYPREVSFQASNERVDELDLYKKGDLVEITFSIQSNKWKDKYFTSLNIERIIKTNNCGSNENTCSVRGKPSSNKGVKKVRT